MDVKLSWTPKTGAHPLPTADETHPWLAQPAGFSEVAVAQGVLPLSIVSDCSLLREGAAALLSARLSLQLLCSYGAHDQPDPATPNPPGHVVLIDGNLEVGALLAWLRFWRSCAPPAATIVIGVAPDPQRILALIEAGASGYTPQQASVGEVATTIRAVQSGGALCSPEVAGRLFARLAALCDRASVQAAAATSLTPRELEVLRLIAADYSNKQIAAALVIEVRTVKHHVHNILEKLQLRHRWDAARAAVERGWIGGEAGTQR